MQIAVQFQNIQGIRDLFSGLLRNYGQDLHACIIDLISLFLFVIYMILLNRLSLQYRDVTYAIDPLIVFEIALEKI